MLFFPFVLPSFAARSHTLPSHAGHYAKYDNIFLGMVRPSVRPTDQPMNSDSRTILDEAKKTTSRENWNTVMLERTRRYLRFIINITAHQTDDSWTYLQLLVMHGCMLIPLAHHNFTPPITWNVNYV